MRILIVEDDSVLADGLTRSLRNAEYAVDCVTNGAEADHVLSAQTYDLVILDAPPLLGFAECLQMASAADGVLVTAIAGKTKRRAVAEVIGSLHRVHANIIGVVLNQVSRTTFAEGYSYYGKYGYGDYSRPEEVHADSEV